MSEGEGVYAFEDVAVAVAEEFAGDVITCKEFRKSHTNFEDDDVDKRNYRFVCCFACCSNSL